MLGFDVVTYQFRCTTIIWISIYVMFYCNSSSCLAQQQVSVNFDLYYHGKLVNVNHNSDTLIRSNDCTITALKLYLTKIKFYHDNSLVYCPHIDAHLIDVSKPSTCQWYEAIPDGIVFNKVHFTIGVDSLTHRRGPLDGALDPINGMYWTWQSGYINVKIEGTSSRSSAKGKRIQYHIGGYHSATNTVREITLPIYGNNLYIGFDIGQFFDNVDFDVNHIMAPSPKAAQLSTLIASCILSRKE